MEDGGGRPGNSDDGRKSPDGGRCTSPRRNPEGERVHPTTSQANVWVIRELDTSDKRQASTKVKRAV